MPSSVRFQRMGHSSLSTHVTEGSLSSSAGSRTTDSGNTGDGASSSPGLGGVLHTGLAVDGVGLAGVLRQVGVHELHDVQADRGLEHGGQHDLARRHLVGVFDVPYGY